jgi:hypothetical protein
MNKEDMIDKHNRIQLDLTKAGNAAICNYMDEPRRH